MAKKTSANGNSFEPMFGENQVTGDPRAFRVSHPSDFPLYKLVNAKLLQPIPKPRDPSKMVLTLKEVLGKHGAKRMSAITKAKKIVFHMAGDTGMSHYSTQTEKRVTEKMVSDFSNEHIHEIPSFLFHLGDVVYSFGEGRYYYDQFYDPFRDYEAPILAIPGNHDGMVYKGDKGKTLEAFLRNFVSEKPEHTDEAMGLVRTAMIQPGVYFAFDAPYVTIIGLYSNVLEDPGVISSQGVKGSKVNNQQLTFLVEQLKRVKQMSNAVIVAVHHPPFTAGKAHGASPKMLHDLDRACRQAKFWPHAFLSGHAHNYQRFTRTVNDFDNPSEKLDIPYVVCGNSGHNVSSLSKKNNGPMRTPQKISGELLFENYDDSNYGYLRVICDAKQLRIEYHDSNPDQKSESDAVTVDLKTHQMISN